MSRDDSGQFLLLSSVVVCIGLVVLLVFLNQSSMGGHSSSDSIMNFPKNDIREIRDETVSEVYSLGAAQNMNNVTDLSKFNWSFANYSSDLSGIYARQGCVVKVSCTPTLANNKITNATVIIYYNDGETSYNETTNVNIV